MTIILTICAVCAVWAVFAAVFTYCWSRHWQLARRRDQAHGHHPATRTTVTDQALEEFLTDLETNPPGGTK